MVRKYYLIFTFSVILTVINPQLNSDVFGQEISCSTISIRKNGKWGTIDRNGKSVIEPKFDSIIDFNGESGLAKKDGLWGIIDKKGEWIIEPSYQFVSDGFFDGIAYVVKDRRYYLIDRKGNPIAGSFDGARDFWEGLGRIKLGNKWGFINNQGNIVISPQFNEAGSFSNGIARVETDGKVFYINKLGQKVLELPKNMGSGHFSEGLAFFQYDGSDVYGYINTKGEVVIEPQFREVSEFVEERAGVVIDGKFGFIDKQGKIIVPAKYDKVEDFSEGLAAVRIGKTGDKFGYIDKNGKEILLFKYDHAGDFKCGIAYVEIEGEWTYIDKKGNPIFKPAKL